MQIRRIAIIRGSKQTSFPLSEWILSQIKKDSEGKHTIIYPFLMLLLTRVLIARRLKVSVSFESLG